jgi:IS5 family transposase
MGGQPSFADLAMARRRPGELDRIAGLINWGPIEYRLAKLVQRIGRPPVPPMLMLRALLLGQWHTLSDRDLEAALDDRASFRRFCGLAAEDPVPDHSTLCRFRTTLIERGLHDKLLGIVNGQLDAQGFLLRRGTMIDATVIAAAVNPSGDAAHPSDPDAAFVRRQGRSGSVFGFKAHVAADQDTLLVRELIVTPANVNETEVADRLIEACADAPAVYADKAYDTHARRMWLHQLGLADGIQSRGNRHHALSPEARARNSALGRVRGRVETVFAVIKRRYRLDRSRYVGRVKTALQFSLAAIGFNLRRALRLHDQAQSVSAA